MEGQILKPQQQSEALQIGGETASMVLAAQAKALVEARYSMAMMRPRDFDEVRSALLKECRRPRFGETARYSVPRGRKKDKNGEWVDNYIEGFSIRFAEAAIRCMKNITVETITVYDDREKRILRATVTDLESNVPYSLDITVQKTMERSKVKDGDTILKTRLNTYGKEVYLIEATDDDILNKQNALISKAVRTLGLRHIPGDLLDEAEEEIFRTQRKQDAEDPDAAKKKLLDAFDAVGVSVSQIKEYVGHDLAILDQKTLTLLRGIYAAMREGEVSWSEVMDEKASKIEKPAEATGGNRTQSVVDKIKKATEKPVEAPVPAQPSTPQPETEKTQEEAKAAEGGISALASDIFTPTVIDVNNLPFEQDVCGGSFVKGVNKNPKNGGHRYAIVTFADGDGHETDLFCFNTKMNWPAKGTTCRYVFGSEKNPDSPGTDRFTFEGFVQVDGKPTDKYGSLI